MKIFNKKTGEIWELYDTQILSKQNGKISIYATVDGKNYETLEFGSIEELTDIFADYPEEK